MGRHVEAAVGRGGWRVVDQCPRAAPGLPRARRGGPPARHLSRAGPRAGARGATRPGPALTATIL